MKVPVNRFIVYAAAWLIFAVAAVAQDKLPDSDPKLIGSATYAMPQSAIDAEIDGKVTIAVQVDSVGKPTQAVLGAGLIWPCGLMPIKAIEEVSKTLSDTVMTLKFSPAIKDGKPTSKDFGLTFTIKNPKLVPGAAEKDPVTGKPIPRHISGGVLNGKATFLQKPRYPAEAKANRVSGSAIIQVVLDESGKVARAGAISGHPMLQLAARDAACGSKFAPTTLEGRRVKVTGVLTYNFVAGERW